MVGWEFYLWFEFRGLGDELSLFLLIILKIFLCGWGGWGGGCWSERRRLDYDKILREVF